MLCLNAQNGTAAAEEQQQPRAVAADPVQSMSRKAIVKNNLSKQASILTCLYLGNNSCFSNMQTCSVV